MNKNRWLILLMMALLLCPTSCVEVELCEEAEHPHRAHVVFDYQWESDDTPPDSMFIAAVRILNLWKCGIVYNAVTDSGRYYFNAPEAIPVWADPETYHPTPAPPPPDGYHDVVAGDPEPEGPRPEAPYAEPQYEHFALREGTYKFFTLNKDSNEINIDPAYAYIRAANEDMQMTDISVRYTTYGWDSPRLRKVTEDWEDYNTGFDYIQPSTSPLYFDSVNFNNIYKGGQENRVTFHPKRLTQNIDIYVGIGKDVDSIPFTVDSVFAEISGIPVRIGLITGHIDMTRTARMQFSCDLMDAAHRPIEADSPTADTVVAHGNIDVTTIVTPRSASEIAGPGMLILRVHTTAYDDKGIAHPKIYHVRTNLFHPLEQARLTTLTEDGRHAVRSTQHAALDVVLKPKLRGDDIIGNSDEDGGLPDWGDGGVTEDPDDPVEI